MTKVWPETTVGAEFLVQLGKRFDEAVNRGLPKPCLTNRGVRWGRILASEIEVAPLTTQDIRDLRLRYGDVLVCEGGEIGRASVWLDELIECYYANTLHRLRPKNGYDPRLIVSVLEHMHLNGQLTATVGKSSIAHLTKENILRLVIPLPNVPEQHRIACALSDADAVIASLERVNAKKRAIKQGMMQELLTGRTRLPGFNKPWLKIRLGDHVLFVRSVALSRAQLDKSSPLHYLHYGDIHTRTSALLDASVEDMTRVDALLTGSAGRLQIGDLVFADASEDVAGVGKSVEITAIPNGGLVAGLHTIAARFDKRVLADRFKAYLQFHPIFRESLLRLASGTKVLATTKSFISSVQLELPDVDEQFAIANAISEADAEIAAVERRLKSTREIKQGMMQELLSGRTRLPVEEAAE